MPGCVHVQEGGRKDAGGGLCWQAPLNSCNMEVPVCWHKARASASSRTPSPLIYSVHRIRPPPAAAVFSHYAKKNCPDDATKLPTLCLADGSEPSAEQAAAQEVGGPGGRAGTCCFGAAAEGAEVQARCFPLLALRALCT